MEGLGSTAAHDDQALLSINDRPETSQPTEGARRATALSERSRPAKKARVEGADHESTTFVGIQHGERQLTCPCGGAVGAFGGYSTAVNRSKNSRIKKPPPSRQTGH